VEVCVDQYSFVFFANNNIYRQDDEVLMSGSANGADENGAPEDEYEVEDVRKRPKTAYVKKENQIIDLLCSDSRQTSDRYW